MLWELSKSDLESIEETASCAISIHSSFLDHTTFASLRGGVNSIWIEDRSVYQDSI